MPIEEDFYGVSINESIYAMRTLKALIGSLSSGFVYAHKDLNSQGQAFCSDYDIWVSKDEFVVVKEVVS